MPPVFIIVGKGGLSIGTAFIPLPNLYYEQDGNRSRCSGRSGSRCTGSRNGRPRQNCPSSRREARGKTPKTRPADRSAHRLGNLRTKNPLCIINIQPTAYFFNNSAIKIFYHKPHERHELFTPNFSLFVLVCVVRGKTYSW